ncbi:related to alpha-1,2 glucosyltransferase, potassium channel regulator [Cephalotrichum gorgonifer]|uniref:Dol-P-Glc:Glc(2)Man(9)GlcNAc(2)-PP-Dol alpha-1,2-glucosyltransferase n=1 Tax=Cephalotrichum gorgonifer TaxID=2041049 RepID=A0AAE8MT11_9PEZI|nr:related to alpha-1,2 glucosyltransferase, potassium channel regulator [Cephalotrichum gorgonifer]
MVSPTPRLGSYKSVYGPKYHYQTHLFGRSVKQLTRTGFYTAKFGGAAVVGLLLYVSGIPKVQKDVLSPLPIIGPLTDKPVVNESDSDEVFHIPQAQKYCEGKWLEWDDKITTPPGLYGISVLALHARLLVSKLGCSVFNLRSVNVWCITLLTYLAGICRCQIEVNLSKSRGQSRFKPISVYAIHTGFNIGLFPILLFFSVLYYTDVISTLSVLGAYSNHLARVSRPTTSIKSDVWTLALGIFTLFMRQTNVFWVVVYMGGLEAVHAIETIAAKLPKHRASGPAKSVLWRHCFSSSLGDIHDPPFSQAWPDDLLFTVVSVGVAVVSNPLRILKQVWPHIATMAAFAGFVAWNGGVVLGDKSNHVATIHLPQMLYIWPFFAFFSAPLLLPAAVSVGEGTFSLLRRLFSTSGGKGYPTAHATGALRSEEPVFKRVKLNYVNFSESTPVEQSFGAPSRYTVAGAPRWRVLICAALLPIVAAVAVVVVKYNTIIHPFTLADNRHYMFYVFRYTIRRPGLFRFALIPAYLLSAALVLGGLALGDYGPPSSAMPSFNHPFLEPPAMKGPPPTSGPSRSKGNCEVAAQSRADAAATEAYPEGPPCVLISHLDANGAASSTVPLTTVIILFLATALSLITAPLVEPRYFIIPWVMWRLQVPAWSTKGAPAVLWRIPVVRQILLLGRIIDLRLVLETFWFLAVNWATMSIFLSKPFQWVAEDGTLLDGGRLQRFMW